MDVTLKGVGPNATAEQQTDPTHRASRVSLRPPDFFAVGGAYSFALSSGLMAAGAGAASPIFEMRWASPTLIALVRKLRLEVWAGETAFTAGAALFDVIRATKFVTMDATGGQTITISGKDGARSTRFSPSQLQTAAAAGGGTFGGFAVSNTAALSAGSKTLDSNALAAIVASIPITTVDYKIVDPQNLLIGQTEAALQPIELNVNEGLVVRATVPATGTWRFSVEIDWDEVDPSRYF